jgi:hypothetical protein
MWWHIITHITRKGVEERAVLIILEAIVHLVLPNHTTIAYEVHEVKEVSTSGTVCNEQEGALQATIRPRGGIRMSEIYACE